ncbi:MAG: hypothetical protein J0I32_23510 [Sphingobacteriales bacterium]|nr:hypothetical protein [Sphingobacteriales bacterium]OJW02008.1 MAG: hypothetical protein BGO52_00565 [Sphingobacteriales bacterium 44-61]
MMPHTLIISNQDDVSIEYLISKIEQRGISHLRVNSEDIGSLEFSVNPVGEILCTNQGSIFDLRFTKSVIFRRIPVKYNTGTDGENHKYLNHERKHFFEGLYLTLQHAKWINPMFATQIAERKIFQLQTAHQLGLLTPKTIITNKLSIALDFLTKYKESIIKPISNGLQVIDEKVFSIYTTKVDYTLFSNLNLSPIFDTPAFLQERVSNAADIRVTIIGEVGYAVKILKEGDETDWRKPEIVKKYELTTLPENLMKRLFNLNKHLGLVYSAIDLILTPSGDYVFLEVNPVGEWVWLELELGICISEQILKELL